MSMIKNKSNWKQEVPKIQLPKGFVPPSKLRPIVRAFENARNIILHDDINKPITMPNKSLFLVGGAVRDFLKNKTISDYDLATDASPEQIVIILTAEGFKYNGDNIDKENLSLPTQIKIGEEGKTKNPTKQASDSDRKTWCVLKKESKSNGKPYSICAKVDGEEFEISTLRKNSKGNESSNNVEFTDDIREDATRRDLTINSLYIELNKSDGENKILFDPLRTGLSDIEEGFIKANGRAKDRFEEDPIRILRSIRFYCKYSDKENLDDDIKKGIIDFPENILKVSKLKTISDEVIKAIKNQDIDKEKYFKTLDKVGLLSVIFPNISKPKEFANINDPSLAIAYLFKDTYLEDVIKSLNYEYKNGSLEWDDELKNNVQFLLRLREFNPNHAGFYEKLKFKTSLSGKQIRDWVDLFKDENGQYLRPTWANAIKVFSNYDIKLS